MQATTTKNAKAVQAVSDFATENTVALRTVELDVTDTASVNAAIANVVNESGRLDVIVHNAGHMCYGPAESFSPEQMSAYYNVNAVGAHRVNRAALPYMRRAGSGLVLWVGSTSTSGEGKQMGNSNLYCIAWCLHIGNKSFFLCGKRRRRQD